MNLEAIAPIIEQIVKDTLRERRYYFGHMGKSGMSNKVASGTLVNSVRVNVKNKNDINTLEIDIAGYGNFVDVGRSPGLRGVPVEAIKIWMEEKGIGIRNEQGKFVKGHRQRKKDYKKGKGDVYSIAFAIQKSIERFGIRSAGFTEIALGKIAENKKIMSLLEGQAIQDLMNIIQQA